MHHRSFPGPRVAEQPQHGLVGAHALDALDPADDRSFARHLTSCEDCRAEAASLREAAAAVAAAHETPAPSALRGRVMHEITIVRPLPPEAPVSARVDELAARRRPRRRSVTLAVTGAAAAVVLTIGTAVGIGFGPTGDETPTVSPAQRVIRADDALHSSVDLGDGARATVIHSESIGQSVIRTEGMAPPPAGSVYQLWYAEDGELVNAGLMPSGEPDQTVRLRGDSRDATGVGITVEPEGGSDEPTTDPIAMFDFGPAA